MASGSCSGNSVARPDRWAMYCSHESGSAENPLHGVTLEAMLEQLVARHGWPELSARISIRCFSHEPSIKSSLKFLRRTEWARAAVEQLYLADQSQLERHRKRNRSGQLGGLMPPHARACRRQRTLGTQSRDRGRDCAKRYSRRTRRRLTHAEGVMPGGRASAHELG